jgi:hypothetical protein
VRRWMLYATRCSHVANTSSRTIAATCTICRSRVSLDGLTGDPKYLDFLGDSGTHSIIDVHEVVLPDPAGAEYGEVMLLGENEYAELFGTARPSRAQFEAADPKVLSPGYRARAREP